MSFKKSGNAAHWAFAAASIVLRRRSSVKVIEPKAFTAEPAGNLLGVYHVVVDVGNDLLSSDQDIMLLINEEELHDVFLDQRTHRHPATIGIIDLAIGVPAVDVEMIFLNGID